MIYRVGIHFTFLFFILTVTGCSSHVALTKETRTSLRLVEVSREVKVPDRIEVVKNFYFGGAVAALAAIIDKPDKEKMEKMVEILHTEIPKMVHERFVSALKESKMVQRVAEGTGHGDNPDAIFLLAIDKYGFQGQKPLLCVTGRLILGPPVKPTWTKNSAGAKWTIVVENPERHPIMWEKHACEFGQFVELPTEEVKFYANNPDITRDAFTKASQSVVDQLINDMKENYE